MQKIIYTILIFFFSMQAANSQWVQQSSGTDQNLYDVEFINEKTGWAVGDGGVVIKTTNAGTNWVNLPNPSPSLSPNLWSVEPIDSNIVYITSGKDLIIKTTNGGINWDVLNYCPDCNSAMIGIYFLNKDTGWFLGANKVFRTFDGGETLDSFYAPWFDNFEIYFTDINTGLFTGDGRVFKTTDKGESWFDTNVPTFGTFYMFRKLAVNNNKVWVVGSSSPVFRSTNFGDSWEIITPGQQIGGIGINFVNQNTGYIGRSLNNLIKTTNGGFNWYQQRTDSNSLAFISSFAFVNDTVGWYSCGVGRIYKTNSGGQWLTNISQITNTTPSSFSLYQNYPNPFNSKTQIEFDVPNKNNYKLEIYNLIGKKIAEVFNQEYALGRYKILYNADDLSSGIYIYRISSKENSISKKFILLK